MATSAAVAATTTVTGLSAPLSPCLCVTNLVLVRGVAWRGAAHLLTHLLLLPRIYIYIYLRADCAQARGGFTGRFGGVAAEVLRAYGAMLDRFGRLEGAERRRRARSARHLRRNRSF